MNPQLFNDFGSRRDHSIASETWFQFLDLGRREVGIWPGESRMIHSAGLKGGSQTRCTFGESFAKYADTALILSY